MISKTVCKLLLLVAIVSFAPAQSALATIIESEPNNTPATADVIVRNTPTFADAGLVSLDSAGGDVDVFSINLLAGDLLLVNTTGIDGLPIGDNPNTVLGIFDPSDVLVDVDDDGGLNFGSDITFFVPADGQYSIAVTGFDDGLGTIGSSTFGDSGVFDGSHSETGDFLLIVSVVPIPEPSSLLLASVGLLFALRARRRLGNVSQR